MAIAARHVVGAEQHASQAYVSALRHAEPGQREDLHGDADHDARPLANEMVESRGVVTDRAVRQRRRPEPPETAGQQLSDAARPLAGQQDQNPIAGTGQHRHAVLEEVDGELLIGGAEPDALGSPAVPDVGRVTMRSISLAGAQHRRAA